MLLGPHHVSRCQKIAKMYDAVKISSCEPWRFKALYWSDSRSVACTGILTIRRFSEEEGIWVQPKTCHDGEQPAGPSPHTMIGGIHEGASSREVEPYGIRSSTTNGSAEDPRKYGFGHRPTASGAAIGTVRFWPDRDLAKSLANVWRAQKAARRPQNVA